MRRPLLTWMTFLAAIAVATGVMLFFSLRILAYERSMAEAQAHAALEETVRLALWRMDSTAAVMLGRGAGAAQQMNNANTPISQDASLKERYLPRSQVAMSNNEAQIRRDLDPPLPGDWHKIAPVLLNRVRDILPGAKLEDAPANANPADTRLLATIPARLVVPASALPDSSLPWNTPARVSLLIAWACALLSALAAAQLLAATLSLSQRRGAFASAVTHELRTPLTTFRMYAEMLATGMVGEESKRKQYLDTLVAESDRLGHLIENVLAYSRLENRAFPARADSAQTVGQLLDHSLPMLRRRAQQAGVPLYADIANPAEPCQADPVAVGQILINLVDNACKYSQSPIDLSAATTRDHLKIIVRDRGPGIPADKRRRLFAAFNKSKNDPIPGIGLGLFVARQLARNMAGTLEYLPADPGAQFKLLIPR